MSLLLQKDSTGSGALLKCSTGGELQGSCNCVTPSFLYIHDVITRCGQDNDYSIDQPVASYADCLIQFPFLHNGPAISQFIPSIFTIGNWDFNNYSDPLNLNFNGIGITSADNNNSGLFLTHDVPNDAWYLVGWAANFNIGLPDGNLRIQYVKSPAGSSPLGIYVVGNPDGDTVNGSPATIHVTLV